jgi:hypothetical protein
MHPVLRIATATAAFAIMHSTLASRRAKQIAAANLGDRQQKGFYRAAFVGQSILTSAALAEFIRRQPDRTLYDLPSPWRYALRLGQGVCLGFTVWAARQAGIARLSGWESLVAWQRGDRSPVEPAAQGPSLECLERLSERGPFTWSRHPLNFWPLMVLLLNPRMTVNRLTFATFAGGYLALGSVHEESRLVAAHGDPYKRYQASDIPFYLPRLRLLLQGRHKHRSKVLRHDRRGLATHPAVSLWAHSN